MIRIQHSIVFILTCLLMGACSNTRHIPKGDSLFIGTKVNINDDQAERQEKKVMKGDLEDAVRPKPNSQLLGMRIKLSIYNLMGDPSKNKGIRKWIRNKFGEPPVLASSVDLEYNEKLLQNILENRGFFFPAVDGSLDTKRKK